jgi:hypothetical protein
LIAALPKASLSMNVGGYINGSLNHDRSYSPLEMTVYAVRDGDLRFYVGRSELALRRLEQHIGNIYDRANVSPVGWLIRDNLPHSLMWFIDLYTPQDWDCLDASVAERRAIEAFRPCLNKALNPDPQPIPAKYRREERRWRKQIDERLFSMAAIRHNFDQR